MPVMGALTQALYATGKALPLWVSRVWWHFATSVCPPPIPPASQMSELLSYMCESAVKPELLALAATSIGHPEPPGLGPTGNGASLTMT